MATIKFYCMSLDSREDRRQKVILKFSQLNIPVEWWIIKRHPNGGKYGCFETHVNIWEHNDADIAVIFEDDFDFNGTKEHFHKILNEAIDVSGKYTTVHLGHITYDIKKQVSENFYEGKFLTTCCYLGRKEKLQQLAPIVKSFYGNHIDIVLSQYSSQVGLFPYRFTQDFTDSNNSWTKDVPIISRWPEIDKNIRIKMTRDPYCLLKQPSLITGGALKFLIVFNTFQHLLPRILYNTGIEFTDRRVNINSSG